MMILVTCFGLAFALLAVVAYIQDRQIRALFEAIAEEKRERQSNWNQVLEMLERKTDKRKSRMPF